MLTKSDVSFDFDGVLDSEMVQLYAQELVKRGLNVWIVTARYKAGTLYRPKVGPLNADLYKIAKKVGIPEDRIIFTEMEPKWKFFKNKGFIFHLDDKFTELEPIGKYTETVPINVGNSSWMGACERLLSQV